MNKGMPPNGPLPHPMATHASAGDHFSFSGPPTKATWASLHFLH